MSEPVFPQSFIDAMSARIMRHIEWEIAYSHLYDEFAFFGSPIRNRGLPSVNTGTRWGPAMNTEQFAANLIGRHHLYLQH